MDSVTAETERFSCRPSTFEYNGKTGARITLASGQKVVKHSNIPRVPEWAVSNSVHKDMDSWEIRLSHVPLLPAVRRTQAVCRGRESSGSMRECNVHGRSQGRPCNDHQVGLCACSGSWAREPGDDQWPFPAEDAALPLSSLHDKMWWRRTIAYGKPRMVSLEKALPS